MSNLDKLSEVYADWCSKTGTPLHSADELLAGPYRLSDSRQKFLSAFVIVWDSIGDLEEEEEEEDSIPQIVKDHIFKARADIDCIHWDYAHFEESTGEWSVPVEAFQYRGCKNPGQSMHGDLLIDLSRGMCEIDYSVSEWKAGSYPDMHTFER